MYKAAVPATCGVAIEVPVMSIDAVSDSNEALSTSTPGACTDTQGPLQHHRQAFSDGIRNNKLRLSRLETTGMTKHWTDQLRKHTSLFLGVGQAFDRASPGIPKDRIRFLWMGAG